MKKINFIYLSFLFVLVLASCQKDYNSYTEDNFDFLSFQKELQSNEHYTSFLNAKTLFLKGVINGEIDVYGISNFIVTQKVENICTIENPELVNFTGSDLFIESHCNILVAMDNLYSQVDELSLLNANQKNIIFTYMPPTEEISFRANCFDNFQDDVAQVYIDYEECLNTMGCVTSELVVGAGIYAAANAYDNCCNNGGSGCP